MTPNLVDVPVTRQLSLTHETKRPARLLSAGFVDWLSLYQCHPEGLPVIADGAVMRFDKDGAHVTTTHQRQRIEGSHDTALFVSCDGSKVTFQGNISKFDRPDNIFGYSFEDAIVKVNAFLQSIGLPPFTAGTRGEVNSSNGWTPTFSGARITRVDVTSNFSTGSPENAYAFMRFLASQQADRLKTGTYGDGETVDFGRGSKYVYTKAYLKGPEIQKHAKNKQDLYLLKLSEFANNIGLVRFESTYKSTFLINNFLQYLGAFDMQTLLNDFDKRQSVFTRANCDIDSIAEQLDKHRLSVYRMWQAGDDLTQKFSRAQFYKHRKALLPFGVDIAVKSNVIQFQPKTRIIKIEPVQIPEWYQFPQPLRRVA